MIETRGPSLVHALGFIPPPSRGTSGGAGVRMQKHRTAGGASSPALLESAFLLPGVPIAASGCAPRQQPPRGHA